MNCKTVFFVGITYLVIGCNSSFKKKISDCDIVKIDVEKYFSNQSLTYSSEKIKFKISYSDTLNGLKKINFIIGQNVKQISSYIYKGHIFEKYYSDRESLLIANLDTSIVFCGVNKLLPAIFSPQASTFNYNNTKKRPFKSRLWGDIDFHNSGNLGRTYVISTKIGKYKFSLISFNLLVDGFNLYLESFTLYDLAAQDVNNN